MATLAQAQTDQARRHIETIRREAGLEGGSSSKRNVQNLQNALHTLAEELYQESTHFLLELIQNADDNEYDVAEPSITLTYKNRHLRIDCNERGFTEKNIEAICRVGSSTKAGKDRASAYVGEKGIGFKSVFKAADVVWISSNSYTFKFDKRQVLGMIAPIWESFPGPEPSSTTSMLLQLSPDYEEKELLSDLKEFDSRMLMFLRRLKRVKIIIHEGGVTWETSLSKRLVTSHQETCIELTQDDKTRRYLVSSYTAKNLAPEPKRPGATESQIVLAFPDFTDTETLEPQKVYAFLPIRDYGFNFLLHGDFLLSANREDILDYSQWNKTLRQEFVNAFVAATKTYSNGQLCHIWPRYVPIQPTQSPFFEPARQEVLERLSRECVLKCRDAELKMPCSLIHVPEDFCDKEGIPMTSSVTNDRRYLSPHYSSSLKENLEVLGVKEMTSSIFLDHLAFFMAQNADLFQKEKSVAWHTRLAEILLKLSLEPGNRERIANLPLIPLSDGRWVSAMGGHVYLPQEAESCPPPEGFQLWLVREDAANHPITRSLYLQLGLKALGQESIAHGIINEHMKESFNPYSMTIPQLISQAVFLFNARVDDYQIKQVWVATGNGSGRSRAEETYLPLKSPFAASHYLVGRPEVPFVHADYLTAGGDNAKRWVEWLEGVAGMAILPRLTERVPNQPTFFRLSRHFSFIMKYSKPNDFLVLLRDNWSHYSSWFEDDSGGLPDSSRKRLTEELQASLVQCRGGSMKPLRAVYLPIPELEGKAQGQVPFIDVDDPLNQHWRRLTVLGLGVEGNVKFYLQCLEAMSERGGPAAVDRATMLLEQIQARCSDDEQLVKNYFVEKPLICIPNTHAGRRARWVEVSSCRWTGPECLRRYVALKNIYPSCQRLFRDFFLIEDATLSDVVRETMSITIGDSLTYVKRLFLELEKQLENDETSTAVDSLRAYNIWPIYTTEDEGDWDWLGCAKDPDSWFIADRTHLLESFRGVVPLVAFPVEDILKMPLLIRKLGCDGRRLTRAATSIAETVEVIHPDLTYQDDLRAKAEFITRLIPHKERGRKEKAAKLKAVKVFSTSIVIQKWAVLVGQESHPGRPKDGSVVLSTEHEALEIYLKNRYFEENKTPADLVEAIAGFCAIDERHSLLLTIALTETPQRIHQWFQRHGVPALNLEDDLPDDVTDVDDFDPRKQVGVAPRRTYKTVVLEEDLARMFAPMASLNKRCIGGIALAYRNADDSNEFSMDDNLSAAELYVNDDGFDDTKSVTSKAESSWSGTTIGSTKKKFRGLLAGSKAREGNLQKPLVPAVDWNLEYIGQRKVSHELRRMLGKAYDPDKHWTSHLRTRHGHKAFAPGRSSNGKLKIYANFTLTDPSKLFTRYLVQGHRDAAKWVVKPPVYHLDVRTTTGDLTSEFSFSNTQLNMARIYTVPARQDAGIPTNVYILVRAFSARDTEAHVQFVLDPWSLYLANKLGLEAEKGYRARLHGAGA